MAARLGQLAVHLQERYAGDAERVWAGATDADDLRARLNALPGFGEIKVRGLASVLAKRYGVAAAEPLVPSFPTLGDVDSPEALERYLEAKREFKAEWAKQAAAESG